MIRSCIASLVVLALTLVVSAAAALADGPPAATTKPAAGSFFQSTEAEDYTIDRKEAYVKVFGAHPKTCGVQRYAFENGKLRLLETWNDEAEKAIAQWRPPSQFRQRLHVDPRNGTLYCHEGKSNGEFMRINTETGRADILELPFTAEDMAIDYEGNILLRCAEVIGRYTLNEMREIPFDYGQECQAYWSSMAKRHANLISGIVLPGNRPVNWIESGMGVNPRGDIIVAACNSQGGYKPRSLELAIGKYSEGGKKYSPAVYPGRLGYGEIHLFDKHGKLVGADIVGKGATEGNGTLIDTKGDVYFLIAQNRRYDNKDFFPLTGCVIKFKRGQGRFISTMGAVPLDKADLPKVPAQFKLYWDGLLWVQDAEWIYPGAGYSRNCAPCTCHNCRFALDTFGRSFIPESVRNQIAVLDTNGNLTMHICRYGNVDEGLPLVEDARFRTEKPRSIGGDEVALHYACHVATHSDRRLFISDNGNARILSVKLDYHKTETVPLKGMQDGAGGKQ